MKHFINLAKQRPVNFINDNQIETYFLSPPSYPFNSRPLKVFILLPDDFPHKSPSIGLETNHIWHPNVDFGSGSICLDVLNINWQQFSFNYILNFALPQLLSEPNFVDPLNLKVDLKSWKDVAFKILEKQEKVPQSLIEKNLEFWQQFEGKYLEVTEEVVKSNFQFLDDLQLDL